MLAISIAFMCTIFATFGAWLATEFVSMVYDEDRCSKKILWAAIDSILPASIGSLIYFSCPNWLFAAWLAGTAIGGIAATMLLWRLSRHTAQHR